MALSREFPGFYHYARIMERNKPSRPYDGMGEFSEQHKHMGTQLLTMGATLERCYQALYASENLQVVQPHLKELGRLRRQWLSDLDDFKTSVRAQGADPKVLEYTNEAFARLAERIKRLAG